MQKEKEMYKKLYNDSLKIGLFGFGNDGKTSLNMKFDHIYEPVRIPWEYLYKSKSFFCSGTNGVSLYNVNGIRFCFIHFNTLKEATQFDLDGLIYVYGDRDHCSYEEGHAEIQRYQKDTPLLEIANKRDLGNYCKPFNHIVGRMIVATSCVDDSDETIAGIFMNFVESVHNRSSNR